MTNRQIDDDIVGDGGATAVVSALVLAVLVVFALFYFFSTSNGDTDTIDIQPPRISAGPPAVG